jgi:hypothetical protein
MAAQATVNERIDLKLSAIAAEIDDLPAIAEEWPHMPDDHQAAFLLEWDEMMARMESLDRAFHSHDMTSTQQALYNTLLRKLEEATPTVRQLGLTRPQVAQRL